MCPIAVLIPCKLLGWTTHCRKVLHLHYVLYVFWTCLFLFIVFSSHIAIDYVWSFLLTFSKPLKILYFPVFIHLSPRQKGSQSVPWIEAIPYFSILYVSLSVHFPSPWCREVCWNCTQCRYNSSLDLNTGIISPYIRYFFSYNSSHLVCLLTPTEHQGDIFL